MLWSSGFPDRGRERQRSSWTRASLANLKLARIGGWMMVLQSLKPQQIKWIKAVAFVLCLVPLALLGGKGVRHGLGANPIEYITRSTGWWTLTFLLITLTVTPLRRVAGWNWLLRLRR